MSISKEVREVYFSNLSEIDRGIANTLLDELEEGTTSRLSLKESIEHTRNICRPCDDKRAVMKAVKEAFLTGIIPDLVLSH